MRKNIVRLMRIIIITTLVGVMGAMLVACNPFQLNPPPQTTVTVQAPAVTKTVTVEAPPKTVTVTHTVPVTVAPPPPTTTTTPPSDNNTNKIGQDVTVGATIWTVNSAEDKGRILPASESRDVPPKDKTTTGKFIKVTFTVQNIDNRVVVGYEMPTLVDSQNRVFGAAVGSEFYIPQGFLWASPTLPPNVPAKFIIIYEVAGNSMGFNLKTNDLGTPYLASGETVLIGLGF